MQAPGISRLGRALLFVFETVTQYAIHGARLDQAVEKGTDIEPRPAR